MGVLGKYMVLSACSILHGWLWVKEINKSRQCAFLCSLSHVQVLLILTILDPFSSLTFLNLLRMQVNLYMDSPGSCPGCSLVLPGSLPRVVNSPFPECTLACLSFDVCLLSSEPAQIPGTSERVQLLPAL